MIVNQMSPGKIINCYKYKSKLNISQILNIKMLRYSSTTLRIDYKDTNKTIKKSKN